MGLLYTATAVERVMKVQEDILRAVSGQISRVQAAEIVGISPRQMLRWRERYEADGYDGLLDRRRQHPSPGAACTSCSPSRDRPAFRSSAPRGSDVDIEVVVKGLESPRFSGSRAARTRFLRRSITRTTTMWLASRYRSPDGRGLRIGCVSGSRQRPQSDCFRCRCTP